MKSASLNLIGIFGVTQELASVTVLEPGTMRLRAIFKNLNSGREGWGREPSCRKRHEILGLSLYLIQLRAAHNPPPGSKRLAAGLKRL